MSSHTQDYHRLQEIFLTAVDLPPEAREAYLQESCQEDAEQLASIKALIEDYESHNGDSLAAATPSDSIAGTLQNRDDAAPTSIGRYRIVEEIGEGGFGTVYLAEQTEPVNRHVALKVIKPGMDTREVIARFEAERQALAMMDHPNIARVFDAGTSEGGRPYFVMEWVRGEPITQYCNTRQLSTRKRLDLFLEVCAAVQHAHQKGIIHRDIKPSNVLVTIDGDKPLTKVIDFGIAKATHQPLTERTVHTRLGQFMGTPAYMSPEQASTSSEDIDTRSDIYALGILLYELLTGAPPFDSKSLLSGGLEEMQRVIREVDPPRPSARITTSGGMDRVRLAKDRNVSPNKLSRLIRSDLDWVVMKAIDKDRGRRYDTANAFSADIECYLRDEPVSAAAPTARYRLGKFVRRHRTPLSVAAVISFLLISATAVSGWLMMKAMRAEEESKTSLAESERARKDSEAVLNILTGILMQPDPALTATVDRSAAWVESQLNSQPRQQAKLRTTFAQAYRLLGQPGKSLVLAERSHAYFASTLGNKHVETQRAQAELAEAKLAAGNIDEAIADYTDLKDYLIGEFGKRNQNTLNAMHNLALAIKADGRSEEALTLQREVLTLRQEVNGPEASDTQKALFNLGQTYYDRGKVAEGLNYHTQVWKILQKHKLTHHPNALDTLAALASGHGRLKQPDEALAYREAELELSRQLHGDTHERTLISMTSLAQACFFAGQQQRALRIQEEAVARCEEHLGPEHSLTLDTRLNLVNFYHSSGGTEEAMLLSLIERLKQLHGAKSGIVYRTMFNLSKHYDDLGRFNEAVRVAREAYEMCRDLEGLENPATARVQGRLGTALMGAGQFTEAKETLSDALRILERKQYAPDQVEYEQTLGCMTNLAAAMASTGDLPGAIELQENALALKREHLRKDHPFLHIAFSHLAGLYDKNGETDRALQLIETQLETYQQTTDQNGSDNLSVQDTSIAALQKVGKTYQRIGQTQRAIEMYRQAVATSQEIHGDTSPETLDARLTLVKGLSTAGQSSESGAAREMIMQQLVDERGPRDRSTLQIMAELGIQYMASGDWKRSRQLRERVLEVAEKEFGERDPLSMAAMTNLAQTYYRIYQTDPNQERYLNEAVQLLKRSIKLKKAYLPRNHPYLQVALRHLPPVLKDTGQLDASLDASQEYLELLVELHGPTDERAIAALNRLIRDCVTTGRQERGSELLNGLLEVLRTPDAHAQLSEEALTALSQSVQGLSRYQRFEEASQLGEVMVELYRHQTGEHSSPTLAARFTYGEMVAANKDIARGFQLQKEAIELMYAHLDPDDKALPRAIASFTAFCKYIGRPKVVVEILEPILGKWESQYGRQTNATLSAMAWLASARKGAEQYAEALKLYDQISQMSPKVLGETHRDTLGNMTNKAWLLFQMKRINEAIALQEEALELKEKSMRPHDPFLLTAMDNLRQMYESVNETEKLARLQAKAKARGKTMTQAASTTIPEVTAPEATPGKKVLIPPTSRWAWLHPTDNRDPKERDPDFHDTFHQLGYVLDSHWKVDRDSNGPNGGFGYDEDPEVNFLGIHIGAATRPGGTRTAYFRHEFVVDQAYKELELHCHRDDGIIVYLDGEEVARDNMADGAASYHLPAKRPIPHEEENTVHRIPLRGTLSKGKHVLAISLHNPSGPSSDLRIGSIQLLGQER